MNQRAIAILRKTGRATLRQLAEAEGIDVTGGPPWRGAHPIFFLARDIVAAGARRAGGSGLELRFELSRTMAAPRGVRP